MMEFRGFSSGLSCPECGKEYLLSESLNFASENWIGPPRIHLESFQQVCDS